VQRVVGGEEGPLNGFAMNEGDFELYGGPLGEAGVDVLVNMIVIMIIMIAPFSNAFVRQGQIPFRVLLPLRSQSTNVRCPWNTRISHTKRGLVANYMHIMLRMTMACAMQIKS
jgi:hypothetical protein